MTTLTDLKGIVDFRYIRQAAARKIPETLIGNGEFKVYFDAVKEEIIRELNVSRLSTKIDLTPVTVYTEYALPTTYGGYINHEITFSGVSTKSTGLQLKSYEELPTAGDLTAGTPHNLAIFTKETGLSYVYLYPLVAYTGSLTVHYRYASPISAGGGSNQSMAGTIDLPTNLHQLLIEGILAQIFPDLAPIYYTKLDNMRAYRLIPAKGSISYSFGGLDDDDFDNGFSKNFNGE